MPTDDEIKAFMGALLGWLNALGVTWYPTQWATDSDGAR
jgi:hypothetical protein